jgi:hypothetical protein
VLAAGLLVSLAGLSVAAVGLGHVSGSQYQYGPGGHQYGPGGKQYGKTKVAVCHKGRKTIVIGKPAVRAHLAHGDTLGSCSSTSSAAPQHVEHGQGHGHGKKK